MKNLILAALIAGVSVSSVSAMTTSGQLSEVDRIDAQRLVPSADLTGLSQAQVIAIEFLLTSDNLRAGNNPVGKLKAILASN
jgi:hypothetical protein